MDSLSGFSVFVQVAETRSFVAAGRALGVSASASGWPLAASITPPSTSMASE